MYKSKIYSTSKPAGAVELNMVPMVDVAFLMILFFILTGQIVSATFSTLQVPSPVGSVAQKAEGKPDAPNRLIINVLCKVNVSDKTAPPELTLQASEYSIGGRSYPVGETAGLVREIKLRRDGAVKDGYKDFFVEIRADKRVAFSDVRAVMAAAGQAGIRKTYITALEGSGT